MAPPVRHHRNHYTTRSQGYDWIAVYPSLILNADNQGIDRAWRLWELAHHLDTAGSGTIKPSELEEEFLSLGLTKRTYRRYLKQAIEIGLIHPSDYRYNLLGHKKACRLFKVPHIDTHKARMRLSDLFGYGWKAHLFDAFHAAHGDKPIARSTIEWMTGKAKTTQRRYEKKAHVRIRQNIAIYDIPANWDWIKYQQEECGRYFTAMNGKLARPLPNIYLPKRAYQWKKGRSRKIRQAIETSSFWGRGNRRRYARTPKEAARLTQVEDCEVFFPVSIRSTQTLWRTEVAPISGWVWEGLDDGQT